MGEKPPPITNKRKQWFTCRRKGRRWKIIIIPSFNRWANCDGVQPKMGERGVTCPYVQRQWKSVWFWLVKNVIHRLPTALACAPFFKQKPCHKYPLWWHHNSLFYFCSRWCITNVGAAQNVKGAPRSPSSKLRPILANSLFSVNNAGKGLLAVWFNPALKNTCNN